MLKVLVLCNRSVFVILGINLLHFYFSQKSVKKRVYLFNATGYMISQGAFSFNKVFETNSSFYVK